MEGQITRSVAVYGRYLLEEKNLLAVVGDFSKVLAGKAEYDARYGVAAATGESADSLARLMAGASLAAVSLADRESWGWTMTSRGVANGLFCGIEPEGFVCGTAREAPADRAIVHVQRKKGDGPLVESRFDPAAGDPVASVERYFLKVDQIETRLALSGLDGVLVQALPGGALGELSALDAAQLVAEVRGLREANRLRHLDDVAVFYDCRCDEAVIRRMIEGMPAPSRAALWGEEKSLTVACPRCGRDFELSRGGFTFSETSGAIVR